MTRIRVAGTVDIALAKQLDLEHQERKRKAAEAGADAPDYSDTLELIIKKGLIRTKAQQVMQ